MYSVDGFEEGLPGESSTPNDGPEEIEYSISQEELPPEKKEAIDVVYENYNRAGSSEGSSENSIKIDEDALSIDMVDAESDSSKVIRRYLESNQRPLNISSPGYNDDPIESLIQKYNKPK